MITSTSNSKIKHIRALQSRAKARREAGEFVVEGVRLAEEALASAWQPSLGLYIEDLNERGQELIARMQAEDIPLELVGENVMQAASDTQTPQGILLTLPLKELPLPSRPNLVVIADQMRDPGNLGTLLRSAAACSVQAFLLTPGSVDPFSPKVLRGGMGAHFHLPIHKLNPDAITEYISQHGLKTWLAQAGQGTPYHQADLSQPLALIVGGEAEGPSQMLADLALENLQIPMPGKVESLNAGVAGSILLFEILRQRDIL